MKPSSLKEEISQAGFFSSLDDDQLLALVEISSVSTLNAEYVLYYEKEVSDKLYFLIDGFARAYKIDKFGNEINLYYIYADSIISDIKDLSSTMITSFANVKIVETSRVLAIGYERFKEQFLDQKVLCGEFASQMIRSANNMRSLISREFVFNAVAKVSIMLDRELGIFNKLKRSEASLMLNIQPETLSRVLNRLRRDGIIAVHSGVIEVLDSEALRGLYEE